jgi:GH25 family lysozyme M1 (1,4-beta-N-acetylmuramidase)
MSIAFCEAVKAAGYKAGVYSGASFFVNYLNLSKLTSYDIWVARYLYSDKTFSFPSGMSDINKCISLGYKYNNQYTSINADMWQYTSSGVVAGIPGRVDMNYGYKSY